MLVVAAISVIILGILYTIWSSSARQGRQLTLYLDMQRGVRASAAQVQHDLRELVEIVELDREPSGSLKKLVFKVPSGTPRPVTVRYEFDRDKQVFRRDDKSLFEESLIDFQIYPFTLEDRPPTPRSFRRCI
jgi:hypothetical protein